MREILFRGKDNSAEWRYGSYIEKTFGSFIIKWFDNVCACEEYKVDSETVGQYTSLTDKNGTKIFEGGYYL